MKNREEIVKAEARIAELEEVLRAIRYAALDAHYITGNADRRLKLISEAVWKALPESEKEKNEKP